MIHFHSLQVTEVHKETDDCVSIWFNVPPELKDTFRFVQGQSLTVRKEIKGEEIRRTYSICTAPFENKLIIAVKKVEGGIFSTFANNELKKGDVLDVMPPVGNFNTRLDSARKKKYIAFAAGSGITPVLSIIKATLYTEPQSEFTLVFGNRAKSSIIFKEEIEALKDRYLNRFRIYHILSREQTDSPLNFGRIDRDKLELMTDKLIDIKSLDEFFICGPDEMIFCIKNFLIEKGVGNEKIHLELFTIPGEKKPTADKKIIHKESGPIAKVSVKVDGLLFEFDLPYNQDSILDAALNKGADLPYACKGGVCTTCRAKLVEGNVVMDVNWSLEPEELEQGYILTCQSHPITEKVLIDFDAK
ncbi:MAG TPA: 1,2-phenylacetyl-CoA epoxidase subunit PaaE [Flavisolibacter sp.]|nr:1,2-phenylacetyl-CoA epoxidase subunit PaaE [Flavisolibacter sp.]